MKEHNLLFASPGKCGMFRPSCSRRSKSSCQPPGKKSPICGGFFDLPGVQKRLAELDHLMTQEGFWGNREKAQGFIDEANALRKKTEPVLKAERQMEDFKAMLELSQEEPPAEQPKHEADMERDLAQFTRELDSLELKVFLNGPHDKNNCILSINAGAGGTEACDWAEMLLRMYQRWCEGRGWEVELTDVVPGETAGMKSATLLVNADYA